MISKLIIFVAVVLCWSEATAQMWGPDQRHIGGQVPRGNKPNAWTGDHNNVVRTYIPPSGTVFTPPASFGNWWILNNASGQSVACPSSLSDGDTMNFHIQYGPGAPFATPLTFATCYGQVPIGKNAANAVDLIVCFSMSPADVTGSNYICGSPTTPGGTAPPVTVTCDVGPPYTGVIPGPATQAGFTHCAANYDFTQTASFTDNIGTHQWTNLASWFICGQASGTWLFTYHDFSDTACTTGPGNHVNVGLDGTVQTLQLSYFLADKTAGQYSVSLTTATQIALGTPPSGTAGISFPQGMYVEHTLRLSNSTPACSSPGCIEYALGTYAPDYGTGTNPCFVSSDFDEMWQNAGPNGGLHTWNPTCGTSGDSTGPATNPGPVVGTSYATYGILWTNDGTANEGTCNYYRAAIVQGLTGADFRSCITPYTPPFSNAALGLAHRQYIQLWEGPQSAGQGGTNWTATSATTFIQRITVWECPGYGGVSGSGNCFNNPVITTGSP